MDSFGGVVASTRTTRRCHRSRLRVSHPLQPRSDPAAPLHRRAASQSSRPCAPSLGKVSRSLRHRQPSRVSLRGRVRRQVTVSRPEELQERSWSSLTGGIGTTSKVDYASRHCVRRRSSRLGNTSKSRPRPAPSLYVIGSVTTYQPSQSSASIGRVSKDNRLAHTSRSTGLSSARPRSRDVDPWLQLPIDLVIRRPYDFRLRSRARSEVLSPPNARCPYRYCGLRVGSRTRAA